MKTINSFFMIFIVAIIFLTGFPLHLSAKVSGPCVNCHTMHASQGGSMPDTWDLTNAPRDNLLANNCVGCHSSDGSQTIVEINGSRIPIVYNTGGYPANPLAGGNFYYVSSGSPESDKDAYGHNVYGISEQDANLTEAPGRKSCGKTDSCHSTLAVEPLPDNDNRGGCQGCHYKVFHHTDNDVYRFLIGHEGSGDDYYVTGEEDPDWEQNPTQANHNVYKGYDGPVSIDLDQTNSISSFCGGCHTKFHAQSYIGSSSPWLRHPTDMLLRTDGEYAAYDPTSDYSNEAPVAYTNPLSPTRATAVVMCLSCHRPHGSDQPDILRWDYNTMDAGGGGSGGCFTCHTTKN